MKNSKNFWKIIKKIIHEIALGTLYLLIILIPIVCFLALLAKGMLER